MKRLPSERGFDRNRRSVVQHLSINSCLPDVHYGGVWSNLEIPKNNSKLLLTGLRGTEQEEVNETPK